jgi:hypothetical protein
MQLTSAQTQRSRPFSKSDPGGWHQHADLTKHEPAQRVFHREWQRLLHESRKPNNLQEIEEQTWYP